MGISKLKNTNFPGVRYRLHPTRKKGVQRDKYFTIRYYIDGKRVEEGVGWSTENWTAAKAAALRTELQNNARTGEGPRTLAEKNELARRKREIEKRAEEAEQKAREAQAKLDISFKQFFDDHFLPDAKTRWKPETAVKAEQHVKNWIDPVTGDIPMRQLGLADLNKIKANLSKKKRSPRLLQYVFRTFAMVWNAALDHGTVTTPCPTKLQSFRLPKVDNEKQRYLTLNEEKILLDKVKAKNQQAHDMAIVALDAGLRFGEIASLTWGCIDTEKGIVRVLNTKSGKDRYVPMTERLKSLFEAMTAGNPAALVFPNTDGKIQAQIPSAFKRGLSDAKLNENIEDKKMRASFHTLRHTYASRLVQAGVDLYRVQRLMGHSTPVMTARYGKLADDDLRDAVKAMEQDAVIKKSKGKVLPLHQKRNSLKK